MSPAGLKTQFVSYRFAVYEGFGPNKSTAYLGVGSRVTQHPETTSRTSSPTRQPVTIDRRSLT